MCHTALHEPNPSAWCRSPCGRISWWRAWEGVWLALTAPVWDRPEPRWPWRKRRAERGWMPRAVRRVSASMGALPDQGAGRRRREREPPRAGLAHRPRLRPSVRTPRIVWRVRDHTRLAIGSPPPRLPQACCGDRAWRGRERAGGPATRLPVQESRCSANARLLASVPVAFFALPNLCGPPGAAPARRGPAIVRWGVADDRRPFARPRGGAPIPSTPFDAARAVHPIWPAPNSWRDTPTVSRRSVNDLGSPCLQGRRKAFLPTHSVTIRY